MRRHYTIWISEGEFKIYLNTYNDTSHSYGASIKDFQVILRFRNSEDEVTVFKKLKGDLSKLVDRSEEAGKESEFKRFYECYSKEFSKVIPAVRVGLSLILRTLQVSH